MAGVNAAYMIHSILILFIAMDPIGNAPLFFSLTASLSDERRARIITNSCKVATIILVVFAVAGDALLYYFGLTLADFKIAGGLVLLIYGIAGILGWSEASAIPQPSPEDVEALAIVPLATPLLAGPAAIATVLYIKAVYGLAYAFTSIAVNTLVTYAMLSNSDKLLRLLGKNGATALAKVMAMLLTAIAIAMIRMGIMQVVKMG